MNIGDFLTPQSQTISSVVRHHKLAFLLLSLFFFLSTGFASLKSLSGYSIEYVIYTYILCKAQTHSFKAASLFLSSAHYITKTIVMLI